MQNRAEDGLNCTIDERIVGKERERETLGENLRRHLERSISVGELAPGTRLDEKELAARYQVSRTPVREAFRLLAASGMVELRGRQGAIVREIGVNQLLEMFQVMAELEGLCARLAARRITTCQRQRLAEIHQHLVEIGEAPTPDPDLFYQVNLEFHELIYTASHNTFLEEQTHSLRNRVGAYRRQVTNLPQRIASTIEEHERVMQAIFQHDAEAAHNAMRGHLTLLGEDLIDFIAQFGR
ncbi:GntR family transcriptional regulator [Halomonas sp. QX-2]|uniref:GntR family transcriptional regulator n=1 Tax=Vreelandella sedimenti TaxID=2729618 RepID=A0A7Z0N5Q8_9GAMM|nr:MULTISPECIES: GntR family transcriptional regulator [Halomonas]NYT71898.1 GntR family transcriptional regulator [Halomonas sedimenti]|tara:strand:- start:131031 stop:131750 length:720 start_codon:yes stop_codon:yes gene_type:complete